MTAPKEEPLLSESEKKDPKSETLEDTGNTNQSTDEEGLQTLKWQLDCVTSITYLEQKNIGDALRYLVLVTIWRLYDRSNTYECTVTFFSTFTSFLSVLVSMAF